MIKSEFGSQSCRKISREITDGLLMANYQADLGPQNFRESVLKRDIKLLR